jgi:histidyl-tRNA synthetase
MLGSLESDAELTVRVANIKLLASYLKAIDVVGKVSFNLSLSRGVDYYTGLIYEVVVDSTDIPTQVGIIILEGGPYFHPP